MPAARHCGRRAVRSSWWACTTVPSRVDAWSRPAATSPRTEWLELAFPGGAARQVNRVDLYPRTDVPAAENNFPVNLTIKAWNGTAWETVVSRTNLPRLASGQRF